MKEQMISTIEALIWATEHMDSKTGSKLIVSNNQGRAQGAIHLAHCCGIITDSEKEQYWDKANQAAYNNPSYWEN